MAGRRFTRYTPKKRRDFIAELAKGNTVAHSAEVVAGTRERFYQLKREDDGFAAAWAEAEAAGTEVLEQEAKRRAVEGWEEPVYQGGVLVGFVRKHSDTLLIFLLKGRRPDTYRDNQAITLRWDKDAPMHFLIEDRSGYSGS